MFNFLFKGILYLFRKILSLFWASTKCFRTIITRHFPFLFFAISGNIFQLFLLQVASSFSFFLLIPLLSRNIVERSFFQFYWRHQQHCKWQGWREENTTKTEVTDVIVMSPKFSCGKLATNNWIPSKKRLKIWSECV